MEQYLQQINDFVAEFGYFFIIPLLALENIPFIGLIAPGISVLFLTGYFSNILPGGTLVAFFISFLTIVIADTLWYAIGYRYQTRWKWLQFITQKSPNIDELLAKQPFYLIALYQFAPYLRMFLPFALGAYQYSVSQWVRLVCVGSLLFTTVFFGFGYVTAQFIKNTSESSSSLEKVSFIASGFGILYVGYLVVSNLKIRARNKIKK